MDLMHLNVESLANYGYLSVIVDEAPIFPLASPLPETSRRRDMPTFVVMPRTSGDSETRKSSGLMDDGDLLPT